VSPCLNPLVGAEGCGGRAFPHRVLTVPFKLAQDSGPTHETSLASLGREIPINSFAKAACPERAPYLCPAATISVQGPTNPSGPSKARRASSISSHASALAGPTQDDVRCCAPPLAQHRPDLPSARPGLATRVPVGPAQQRSQPAPLSRSVVPKKLMHSLTSSFLPKVGRLGQNPVGYHRSCQTALTAMRPDAEGTGRLDCGLDFTLQEAIHIRRIVDHVAHMPDRFVHDGPNLVTRHTKPAPAK
jgi:hypothetical protein